MFYFSTEDISRQPLGVIHLSGNRVVELPFSTTDSDKFLFEVIPGVYNYNLHPMLINSFPNLSCTRGTFLVKYSYCVEHIIVTHNNLNCPRDTSHYESLIM